jgi:mannose-6-phosphate isomerase class I
VRFQILTCVRGAGKFHFGEKLRQTAAFRRGQTFLLPAAMGEYEMSSAGAGEVVVSYVE